MNVLIGTKPFYIDKSKVMAAGGEGIIVDIGGRQVAKIYHAYSATRAAKLVDFMVLNPDIPRERTVRPLELIREEGRTQKVIGFTMDMVEPGHEPIASLMKRSFRTNNGVTVRDVALYGMDGLDTLLKINRNRMCVGDLNDQNERILPRKTWVVYLDIDSFQFGVYPCMVGTEDYLCPDLYNVDLSKRPMFQPYHDHYSFGVILFRCLTGSHPYGGVHQRLETIPDRAAARIPVWNRDVTRPKIALNFDFISDDLMEIFSRLFEKGERLLFRKEDLQTYAETLVECSKCHAWYPGNRTSCPGCSARTTMVVRMATVKRGVKVEEMIKVVNGKILYFKPVGDSLYCLASEQNRLVLYVKEPNKIATSKVLGPYRRGMHFDIFGNGKYLVVSNNPTSEDLEVYDLSNPAAPVLVTATEAFGGGQAVFSCSRTELYRIAAGSIMRGEVAFGHDLLERRVASAMTNQTWFTVSPNRQSGSEVLVGFNRVFKNYFWFMVVGNKNSDLTLPELEDGESLLDVSLRFSGSSVLVLRKTRKRGTDFARIEVVDISSGTISISNRLKISENPEFAGIHGKAFAQGVVLHATDSGVVQESLATRQKATLAATEPYVDENDSLYPYTNGILVVKEDRVLLLTLTN